MYLRHAHALSQPDSFKLKFFWKAYIFYLWVEGRIVVGTK